MKGKAILQHADFYLRWLAIFNLEVRKIQKKIRTKTSSVET